MEAGEIRRREFTVYDFEVTEVEKEDGYEGREPPFVVQVTTGDAQGRIKVWDLSLLLAPFGIEAVGIEDMDCSQQTYEPHLKKHRLYEQNVPIAYDPSHDTVKAKNSHSHSRTRSEGSPPVHERRNRRIRESKQQQEQHPSISSSQERRNGDMKGKQDKGKLTARNNGRRLNQPDSLPAIPAASGGHVSGNDTQATGFKPSEMPPDTKRDVSSTGIVRPRDITSAMKARRFQIKEEEVKERAGLDPAFKPRIKTIRFPDIPIADRVMKLPQRSPGWYFHSARASPAS